MDAPYHPVRQQGFLFGTLAVGGLVGQVLAILAVAPHAPGWVTFLIAFLPMIGVVLLIIWAGGVQERGRLAGIERFLRDQDMRVNMKPTLEERQEVYRHVEHLTHNSYLVGGSANIVWYAVRGPHLVVFEHAFSRGQGRHREYYNRLCICVQASDPDHPKARCGFWSPDLFVGRQIPYYRAQAEREGKLTSFGQPEFEKVWSVMGPAEAAQCFFTEIVRGKLANSPVEEWWFIGYGCVCLTTRGPFDAENVRAVLWRTLDILSVNDGND